MKARLILSMAAALSVFSCFTVMVSAEGSAAGHITFYADKAVIGQGYTVEPVEVPFYEGDSGIDVIKRAADAVVTESEYGDYISGFADEDIGGEIPAAIAEVVPEMSGRNIDGYLCSFDYTSESGWSYFLNGEYAQVGISEYDPADGDVIRFSFTVYGYGADLGVDNSSWGGTPALVEMVNTSDLAKYLAQNKDDGSIEYKNAKDAIVKFGVTQTEIDNAYNALLSSAAQKPAEETKDSKPENSGAVTNPSENSKPSADKGSPNTGVEGVAVAVGAAVLACGAVALCKKK